MNKILDEFAKITVWSRREERAPHKPLLILYALGALLRGEYKLLFTECEKPLIELLREYGPRRRSYRPQYPFWRLQNDGVWLLDNAEKCQIRAGNTDARVSDLRANAVCGYFRPDIIDGLIADKLLFAEVVKTILDNHFPESLHGEIQEACGITLEFSRASKKRDPAFREKVLRAYQYKCAVCDFRAQIDGRHLALEAAHIKWHAAGGPDIESNGIAMCSLHHKLFDKGAFMFRKNRLYLSECVYGEEGTKSFQDMLVGVHGKELSQAIRKEYMPNPDWLDWHEKEVFKGPFRSV
ncbi:HNH endonuclease [Pseudomonadales bacterium]|nr:HNH endonuclease [Pseudomonadales bacterium]